MKSTKVHWASTFDHFATPSASKYYCPQGVRASALERNSRAHPNQTITPQAHLNAV